MKISKRITVYIILLLLISISIYFICNQPNKKITKKTIQKQEQKIEEKEIQQTQISVKVDTLTENRKITTSKNENVLKKDTINRKITTPITTEETIIDIVPNMARSIFHDFWVSYFAGVYKDKKINIDEGKKIVCLFDTKNNYNIEVATSVSNLLKNKEIPSVFTIFGGCGSDAVFAFYKKAGCNFPSTETDLKGFNEYLGTYKCPAVFYLWNGNIIKVYEGEGINKFNAEDLKKVCNAKYVPKKRNASK